MSGQESIYNLVPKQQRAGDKASRYQSNFGAAARSEYKGEGCRYSHKTMGVAKESIPDPKSYLKSHTNDPQIAIDEAYRLQQEQLLKEQQQKSLQNDDSNEESGNCENGQSMLSVPKFRYDSANRKPPVPRKDEKPVMGLTSNKNFVTQNAVEVINSVAKKPERAFIDRRKGDRFDLDPSGLEPVYLKRKDFGKVPDYLVQRKDELKQAQLEYDNYVSEMQRRGDMYRLSEQERQEIINGLKQNWEELHHSYQQMSVMIDTIPKRNRKEFLENEMKSIESDLETLERFPVIYIE